MNLDDVETILRNDSRLKPIPLHDEEYELTFEAINGRQIALNRKSSANAIRIWFEQAIDLDPYALGLSDEATVTHYPSTRARAHLSAKRLTGPYRSRAGHDAWYVSFTSERDLRLLLDAYLKKQMS